MYMTLGIHLLLLLGGAHAGILLWWRRRRRGALLAILITPVLMCGWFHLTAIDKVSSQLYPSDTEYASGFSEEAFATISLGTDSQEVLKRLGQPLSKRMAFDGREYWYYSRPGVNYQNYWNVIIVVDARDGKVGERVREFYVD